VRSCAEFFTTAPKKSGTTFARTHTTSTAQPTRWVLPTASCPCARADAKPGASDDATPIAKACDVARVRDVEDERRIQRRIRGIADSAQDVIQGLMANFARPLDGDLEELFLHKIAKTVEREVDVLEALPTELIRDMARVVVTALRVNFRAGAADVKLERTCETLLLRLAYCDAGRLHLAREGGIEAYVTLLRRNAAADVPIINRHTFGICYLIHFVWHGFTDAVDATDAVPVLMGTLASPFWRQQREVCIRAEYAIELLALNGSVSLQRHRLLERYTVECLI
jgi:hypothetical protein